MSTEEFESQSVMVGYHGRWTPIRFVGKKIFENTNKDDGANSRYYHYWKLYAVEGGGFRIHDIFTDDVKNRQNLQLSERMTGGEVAYHNPQLALGAVEANVLKEEDITLDAEHRDLLEAEQRVREEIRTAKDAGYDEHQEAAEGMDDLYSRRNAIEKRLSRYRDWRF